MKQGMTRGGAWLVSVAVLFGSKGAAIADDSPPMLYNAFDLAGNQIPAFQLGEHEIDYGAAAVDARGRAQADRPGVSVDAVRSLGAPTAHAASGSRSTAHSADCVGYVSGGRVMARSWRWMGVVVCSAVMGHMVVAAADPVPAEPAADNRTRDAEETAPSNPQDPAPQAEKNAVPSGAATEGLALAKGQGEDSTKKQDEDSTKKKATANRERGWAVAVWRPGVVDHRRCWRHVDRLLQADAEPRTGVRDTVDAVARPGAQECRRQLDHRRRGQSRLWSERP